MDEKNYGDSVFALLRSAVPGGEMTEEEKAKIPFIPLKGSVLRKYYPAPWMRTSCDIDVPVHKKTPRAAITALTESLGYTEKGSGTHDVSLFNESGVHIELHFDLAEEGCADGALPVLQTVWDNTAPGKTETA